MQCHSPGNIQVNSAVFTTSLVPAQSITTIQEIDGKLLYLIMEAELYTSPVLLLDPASITPELVLSVPAAALTRAEDYWQRLQGIPTAAFNSVLCSWQE